MLTHAAFFPSELVMVLLMAMCLIFLSSAPSHCGEFKPRTSNRLKGISSYLYFMQTLFFKTRKGTGGSDTISYINERLPVKQQLVLIRKMHFLVFRSLVLISLDTRSCFIPFLRFYHHNKLFNMQKH